MTRDKHVPYDAMLDLYEPGMTVLELDAIFANLKTWLPGLIEKAIVIQKQNDFADLVPGGAADDVPFGKAPREAVGSATMVAVPTLPNAPKTARINSFVDLKIEFPESTLAKVGREVMELLQFDFTRGRLDTSAHPFCGGTSSSDVRLTTRWDTDDFWMGLLGVVHETGHARYEQGLPEVWAGQPAGKARSMGVHESQSLFLEMQVARSFEFAELLVPMLRKAFVGEEVTVGLLGEEAVDVAEESSLNTMINIDSLWKPKSS